MNIDLAAVYAGKVSYADLIRTIRHADLSTMTDELFATIESLLTEATTASILYVPRDPASSEQSGQGWTIGHIVAHLTATLEESAAMAAMLARGVQVEGRLRYETPWEELSTLPLVSARLRESQRICHAFLAAWPDKPHLDVTLTLIPLFGPMNAIGFSVLGIAHGQEHLDQLRDAVRQAISSEKH